MVLHVAMYHEGKPRPVPHNDFNLDWHRDETGRTVVDLANPAKQAPMPSCCHRSITIHQVMLVENVVLIRDVVQARECNKVTESSRTTFQGSNLR